MNESRTMLDQHRTAAQSAILSLMIPVRMNPFAEAAPAPSWHAIVRQIFVGFGRRLSMLWLHRRAWPKTPGSRRRSSTAHRQIDASTGARRGGSGSVDNAE